MPRDDSSHVVHLPTLTLAAFAAESHRRALARDGNFFAWTGGDLGATSCWGRAGSRCLTRWQAIPGCSQVPLHLVSSSVLGDLGGPAAAETSTAVAAKADG
jgi:hypothetical protein